MPVVRGERAARFTFGTPSPRGSIWRAFATVLWKPEQLIDFNSHLQGWETENMPELIHVGIDVSKDALEVACGPESPTQCFTNDDAGHEALVNVLHVHRVDLARPGEALHQGFELRGGQLAKALRHGWSLITRPRQGVTVYST